MHATWIIRLASSCLMPPDANSPGAVQCAAIPSLAASLDARQTVHLHFDVSPDPCMSLALNIPDTVCASAVCKRRQQQGGAPRLSCVCTTVMHRHTT